MEKLISSNERVRRAEEIYARRQNVRERTRRATVNISEPKNFKLLKRIILQIIICTLIYFIFYLISTTDYSFSKITLERTESLLSSDEDFIGIYNDLAKKITGYFEFLNPEEVMPEQNKVVQDNADEVNDTNEVKIEDENNKADDANEVSAIPNIEDNEKTGVENLSDVNISETDRIKASYSFINPLTRKSNIRVWRKGKYFKYSIYIP